MGFERPAGRNRFPRQQAQRCYRQMMRAFRIEREQGGPSEAVKHGRPMAGRPAPVDVGHFGRSRRFFTVCRVPTSFCRNDSLAGLCDPKGSVQRCGEFSTFEGGSACGAALFFGQRLVAKAQILRS